MSGPDHALAARPAAPGERIETIDVVRGFALLGILLMNILAFGLPFRAYSDPTTDGATQGIDLAVFLTVDLLAEGVLRALFSMLFGAGVVMLACGPSSRRLVRSAQCVRPAVPSGMHLRQISGRSPPTARRFRLVDILRAREPCSRASA